MSMIIRVTNALPNSRVEEYANQRIELILGRFESRLSTIDMRIRDANASKGGVDKTCSIDARLIPRGSVHVQATECDVYEAVLKAIRRLETVVAKTVDRGHRSAALRHQQSGLRQQNNELADQAESSR